jgi:hypothetical protein
MAEPGKADEWVEEFIEAAQRLWPSADVDVRLHTAGEDPSDVDVVVEAKRASIPVTVVPGSASHFIQRASRVSRRGADLLPELDESVERDDAYYEEVRQAVGRGAPSVLLGTSTKSLERNLEKLWMVHGASGASQTASPQPSQRLTRTLPATSDAPRVDARRHWLALRGVLIGTSAVFVAVVAALIAVAVATNSTWLVVLAGCVVGAVTALALIFTRFYRLGVTVMNEEMSRRNIRDKPPRSQQAGKGVGK